MSEALINCYVEEGGSRCILEVSRDDRSLLHLKLDPAGLDAVIHRLAMARAALAQPIAAEPDPELIATPAAHWRIAADSQPEARVMALRHPGLGWLAFIIPAPEAVQIARWLIHRADTAL